MQRAAGPGIAGQAGPPAPVDMTLQQQQQQAANMQMRLMLQQQLLFAQQQQGGAVRPPGFGDSNLAAMMAMQNAQGRPNMPLDARQLQMLQAQQLQQQIAAAGGGVTPTVGSAPSPLTSSLNLPGATSAIAPTPTSVSEPVSYILLSVGLRSPMPVAVNAVKSRNSRDAGQSCESTHK
ncbi:hypothetical protein BC830DRAFT_1120173, partial [Chytriomyces sp. MP71]